VAFLIFTPPHASAAAALREPAFGSPPRGDPWTNDRDSLTTPPGGAWRGPAAPGVVNGLIELHRRIDAAHPTETTTGSWEYRDG
jgi:hypothetical protein